MDATPIIAFAIDTLFEYWPKDRPQPDRDTLIAEIHQEYLATVDAAIAGTRADLETLKAQDTADAAAAEPPVASDPPATS